ncbi:3-oxoacyl-ACP synthase [Bizionia saleffrena]|uniref:3-oxoacyl-ACP synthase n=1 Tax=Bizionia saleffrena TaxID=291189 RepID=A0A8H2QLD5_9FLAO|nr:beta-ketoacyl synthase chain length factor [Bizionia saleffrena]TYB74100.1 3-oxoacyl-ACP synthase [Bizionia saleffrena]
MKACYIHSAVSISAQNTFETDLNLSESNPITSKKANANHPQYKTYIAPGALRRMATGVKMGVTAGKKALEKANITNPDAILTGTGMGCIEDTENFLNALIANDEAYLTPTSFIQSTHNTVGAQIALALQCNAYNNTYVHGALSFESALLDGQLLIKNDDSRSVLVGGIDELGKEFIDYTLLVEDKKHGVQVPFSEGASFFVLSSEKQEKAIQLNDIKTFSNITEQEVPTVLNEFLAENNYKPKDIDAVICGNNGSVYDSYYSKARAIFPITTSQLHYKHLFGEYFTASAMALYLGVYILKNQQIYDTLIIGDNSKNSIKTILLYNQFNGRDHSFILLSL